MRNLLKPLAAAGAMVVVMTVRLSPVGAATSTALPPVPVTPQYDTSFVVGFDQDVDAAQAVAIARLHGLQPTRWIDGLHVLVVNTTDPAVTFAGDTGVRTSIDAMSNEPTVTFVERDAVVSVQGEPNDPLYSTDQWAPQLIDAPEAWDLTSATNAIVVAVVDTGVDANHPDLDGKLVPGTDIYNDDDDPSDDNGHGTQVAGILGAATNNGEGIAGIGYDARVMPVKVADHAGLSSYSRISEGIVWATDNGADVINVSMGATADLANLRSAVAYAESAGVVMVASSGNHGSDTPFYPAAYDTVIGVGATDAADGLWSYSGYGEWLSLTAPGVSVMTTRWTGSGGSYSSATGTSYAAPHVAGAAALVLAADDALTASDVRTALQDHAVDLGDSGFDNSFGHGRIDAGAAVMAVVPVSSSPKLLLSLGDTATIAGETYSAADVLAFDSADGSWSTFFDASDLDITKADLTAFAALPDGDLLLAFSGRIDIDGVDGVTQADVVRFTPNQLGDNTAGSFSMYVDGSDVGLHKRAGFDALSVDGDGNLLVSLSGSLGLGDVSADEHDLLAFSPSSLGETTTGTWSMVLDGSAVGLSKRGEDIDAVWFDSASDDVLMSTDGDFEAGGLEGERSDVFACQLDAGGDPTACSFASELEWSGSAHGLDSADIDGLDFVSWDPDFALAMGLPEAGPAQPQP